MEKLKRNAPRTLNDKQWYYVYDGSVDIIAYPDGHAAAMVHLTRRQLLAMLAELRPLRKPTKRPRAQRCVGQR
jgi:hypothetical protein